MLDLIKKYRKNIAAFFIVGVIVIPLLIHIVFKFPAPCEFLVATWGSGDVLAFYGVIIGAIATVVGVYLSIMAAHKSAKEDTNNKVRPFVVVTPFMVEGRVDLIAELLSEQNEPAEKKEDYYREYILEQVCFVLSNGKFTAHSSLSLEQQKAKQKFGTSKIRKEDGSAVLANKNIADLSMLVENLGLGVANRLLIGVNKVDISCDAKEKVLVAPLKVGAQLKLEIYVENPSESDYGDYNLMFEYQDIYENTYRQEYTIELRKNHIGSDWFLWNEGQQIFVGVS